jgi:hypothetical protein
VQKFEGGPKDTLKTMTLTGLSSATEDTGLGGTMEQISGLGAPIEKPENQEPAEIKVSGEVAP